MKMVTGKRMKREAMCSVGRQSSHFQVKYYSATLEVLLTLQVLEFCSSLKALFFCLGGVGMEERWLAVTSARF